MTRTILYVDDNFPNRLLVRRIVEAEGYTLLEAEEAASGWQTAVSHTPDLILMDLHLPGEMNGFDLTRRLKQTSQTSHIPIVAITAYGHDEAEAQALACGCVGFLHKPADIRQIRAALHQHLEGTTAVAPQQQNSTQTYAYI